MMTPVSLTKVPGRISQYPSSHTKFSFLTDSQYQTPKEHSFSSVASAPSADHKFLSTTERCFSSSHSSPCLRPPSRHSDPRPPSQSRGFLLGTRGASPPPSSTSTRGSSPTPYAPARATPVAAVIRSWGLLRTNLSMAQTP